MLIATDLLKLSRYALAPETLLTEGGALASMVLNVVDGEIEFVGLRIEFEKTHPDTPIIDLPGKAIVPGFIDCHAHVGQAFGKTLTGGEPSQIWKRIWVPLEGNHDPESIYISAKWMFLEALRGGFTSLNNFAIVDGEKADAIHRAANDCGIRLISSTGVVENLEASKSLTTGERNALIDRALKRAENHLNACKNKPTIIPVPTNSDSQGIPKRLIL
ncbi:MAG: amidohydrolase family protein [Rhizobiaceae bacterium]|nr:amidohydrolase family protein [Rhizobiaceae bacterium]